MRMGILFSLPPLMLMPSPPSSCFSTFTPRFWFEMASGTCSGRSVKAVRTPAGESGGCAPPAPGCPLPAPLQNEPLVAVPMPLYAAAPSSQLRTRASSLKFTRTLCQRSRTKTSSSPLRCARPPPAPAGPAAAAAAAAATAIFPAFLKCHLSREKHFHKLGAKTNEKKPNQHDPKSTENGTCIERGNLGLFEPIGVLEFSALYI
uniref:Uncharacterized protein n=1 Tax=Equus asinus TaxID=9793 RepID=A0A9L0JRA6_EQUAS